VRYRRWLERRQIDRRGADGSLSDAIVAPHVFVVGLAAGVLGAAAGAPVAAACAAVAAAAAAVPGVHRALRARSVQRAADRAVEEERERRFASRREHWEGLRAEVTDATRQVRHAASLCPAGPLRGRLDEIALEAEAGRQRAEEMVDVGLAIDEALLVRQVPAPDHPRSRDRRKRRRRPSEPDGRRSLRNQRDRIERSIRQVRSSLQASAVLALELATTAALDDDTTDRMSDLVHELDAIRLALDDLRTTAS
jgi:hypothetical protein